MAGIIAKMIRGGATAAGRIYEEKARVDREAAIMAARQDAQNAFITARDEAQGIRTSEENRLQREFTGTQDDKRLSLTERQLKEAERGNLVAESQRGEGLINQRRQIDIAEKGAESETKINKMKLELGNLELNQAKDRDKALKMLKGIADPDRKAEIIEWLNTTAGNESKVIVKQLQNIDGMYTDDFAIFDQRTGRRLDKDTGSSRRDDDPLGLFGGD